MNHPLKLFRKAHKLSQEKMARLLGVSESLVSMVENGQRQLPEYAAAAFNALLEEKRTLATAAATAAAGTLPSFDSLKEMHLQRSTNYLTAYKKECEVKLQKYALQWKKYVEKYQRAVSSLSVAEAKLEALERIQPDGPAAKKAEHEKYRAMNDLASIIRKNPDLLKVKIAGLQQEIRTINTRLSQGTPLQSMETILLPSRPGDNTAVD